MKTITLITCTKNRPEALRLCSRWIGRQTVLDPRNRQYIVNWVVLDDGDYSPACPVIPDGVNLYHIKMITPPGAVSLRYKLSCLFMDMLGDYGALLFPVGGLVFFIEDDDYYQPIYLANMISMLEKYVFVGEGKAWYYNVKYRWSFRHSNLKHASLCQTAFRVCSDSMSIVSRALTDCPTAFVDMALWGLALTNSRATVFASSKPFVVGIKGMPGIQGYGIGHRKDRIPRNADMDPSLSTLRALIGEEAATYEQYGESQQ